MKDKSIIFFTSFLIPANTQTWRAGIHIICYYLLVMLLGSTLSLTFPPHSLSYLIFLIMTIFILGLSLLNNQSNLLTTKFSFWYGYFFYLGSVIAFIGYWFSYYFRLQLNCSYFMSYALTAVICLYTSLYIGVICYIYAKLKTKSNFFNLVIFFPSLWVLTELIRGQFFPRSWYALGYTQVDNPVFHGYFPLLGVYFVSWLVVAISGWFAYCCNELLNILNNRESFKPFRVLSRYIAVIILSIVGFIAISMLLAQINYTKKYGKPITITLLQPSIFSSKNYNINTLHELENISEQLIKQSNTDLIVLPETVFGTYYKNLTEGYLDAINEYIEQHNQTLIFSTPLRGNNNVHQTGIVISNQLESPIYIKHHLVPFGEYNPIKGTFLELFISSFSNQISSNVAGNKHQEPTTILGQRFAFNICYENTVNDYVASNAKSATILLNQSDLSWYGDTNMKDAFLQFSQGRALENQRYFLQDGNTGDTAIINPHGKIEQRIPAFIVGKLIAQIQGYSGITPFQYIGNVPIWLFCLGVLCLTLIIIVRTIVKTKISPFIERN